MQQLADLDEAVTLLRKAVAITPAGHLTTEGHLDRAETLSNLGSALRTRSDRTGQPADLDEAVTCLREAVAIVGNLGYPALSPDMRSNQAGMLSNLANALRARSDRTGLAGLADLNAAVYFLRRAVAITTPGRSSCPGRDAVQPRRHATAMVRPHWAAERPGRGPLHSCARP